MLYFCEPACQNIEKTAKIKHFYDISVLTVFLLLC